MDLIEEFKNCKKIKKYNKVVKGFKENFEKRQNNVNPIEMSDNYTIPNNYKILKKDESIGINRNMDKKLKTGKFTPDLRIDFHGLKLDEAFNSLIYNINYAYENGLKFLLIITGKGNRTADNRDSIKSQIDHWMTHYSIAPKIIKYTDAHQKDGGNGAIYVLVKSKKNT